MLQFILICLFIAILVPIIRFVGFILRVRNLWRAQSESNTSSGGQDSYGGSAYGRTKSRKKKIDPNVGEYVAFTEVEDTTATFADIDSTTTVTEEQITDIKWEDI